MRLKFLKKNDIILSSKGITRLEKLSEHTYLLVDQFGNILVSSVDQPYVKQFDITPFLLDLKDYTVKGINYTGDMKDLDNFKLPAYVKEIMQDINFKFINVVCNGFKVVVKLAREKEFDNPEGNKVKLITLCKIGFIRKRDKSVMFEGIETFTFDESEVRTLIEKVEK